MMITDTVPINIEVILSWRGDIQMDNALLEARISERVSELIDDLGLPAKPQVKISQSYSQNSKSQRSPAILIENKFCRQDTSLLTRDDIGEFEGVVNYVSSVIFSNRTELLTARLMRDLAETHSVQVVALLPEMVRRGYPLSIVEESVREMDPRLPEESRRYQVELSPAARFPRYLTLELGSVLYEGIEDSGEKFAEMIGMMRDGLFYELGVKFPAIRVECSDVIGDFDFRLHIGWIRGPINKTLDTEEFLVNDTPTNLMNRLKIVGRAAQNPANGALCSIVLGADTADRCELDGDYTIWDETGYVVLYLSQQLRANADKFLTVIHVQSMLSQLSEAFPLPIVDLLERFSPTFISDVFRTLVRENFSIRDLRSVMEAMLELNGKLEDVPNGAIVVVPPVARLVRVVVSDSDTLSVEGYVDYIRVAMKRYVTFKHSKEGKLKVIETTTAMEERLRKMSNLFARPEHEELIKVVEMAVQKTNDWYPIIILTSFDVRRKLREAIEIEFPHVSVLSREEVDGFIATKIRIGSLAWE